MSDLDLSKLSNSGLLALNLRQGIFIVVQVDAAIEKCAFTKNALQTDVELLLRQFAVPLINQKHLEESARAGSLEVFVGAIQGEAYGLAWDVRAQLRQWVALPDSAGRFVQAVTRIQVDAGVYGSSHWDKIRAKCLDAVKTIAAELFKGADELRNMSRA